MGLFKSDSNESLDRAKSKLFLLLTFLAANQRKKSGNKAGQKGDKTSHKFNTQEDEEMNKILTALKFFKDHADKNKNSSGVPSQKTQKKDSSMIIKNKENINDKDRSHNTSKEPESRPRTSRGRKNKNRRKSGGSSGGNSALGFHSNLPNHPLLQNNIDNSKHIHNRSVNVVPDSPRSKKRKFPKGRVSPNTFAVHHQRHPSAALNQGNHLRNASLEAEKIALIAKGRPRSAKLKKKKGNLLFILIIM